MSDAHGNIGAFRTAILHLKHLGARSYFYLGDAVGYIPSLEVVDELLSMGASVKCVLGNHEQMLLDGRSPMEREPIYQHQTVRAQISGSQINYLKSWPSYHRLCIDGANSLFVHGSPNNYSNGYVYPDSDLNEFNISDRFVFMGHTHYPFMRRAKNTTFVNVGSCGLPRDDGRYGAFATYEPMANNVKIYRFPIDDSLNYLAAHLSKKIHWSVQALFKRRAVLASEYHILEPR